MDIEVISPIFIGDALGVTMRTAIIFLYAFLLLRILGKRHLSHFGYTELLLVIAFGSAVGDVMVYSENTTHLLSAMLAITVVSIIVKLLNHSSNRWKIINSVVEGHARLLVDEGAVIPAALQKEGLTEEKLCALLREKGHDCIDGVKKAFIEPDGEISVVPIKPRS